MFTCEVLLIFAEKQRYFIQFHSKRFEPVGKKTRGKLFKKGDVGVYLSLAAVD